MTHDEIKLQARQVAETLHDEWLEDRISANLTDGDYERELANDRTGESELQEHVALGRLSEDQLLNAYSDLMFIALKRRTQAHWRNPEDLLASTEACNEPIVTEKLPSVTISEKLEAFLQNKRGENPGIKEATLDEYRVAVRELVEILGDKSASEVSYEDAASYRDTLLKTPKHRRKTAYASKPIAELVALDLPSEQCLSAKTVSGRLANASTYFTWLKVIKAASENPFEHVKLAVASKSYTAYKPEDLATIFTSALYTETPPARSKRSNWWLLLFAAFTGARIGELVQLRLEDLSESAGIFSITVTDEGEDMRVKTAAGRRVIPVHPLLLELGLAEYVSELKVSGEERLLPSIKQGSAKPGSEASKWYCERYRAKHLPASFKEDGKVFHSFRHSFIETAIQCNLDVAKIQQMVGHERAHFGETATYAGAGYTQSQLFEQLKEFEYPGLSLGHLVNGWQRLKHL